MGGDSSRDRHNLMERLDLALASQLARADEEVTTAAERRQDELFRSETGDDSWIAAVLELRGFAVREQDVADVLAGRTGRFRPRHQEHALIFGMRSVLRMIRDSARHGIAPDGWFLVELFRVLTAEVPRFHKRALRGDQPWDGLLYERYPDPGELEAHVDSFNEENSFRDIPVRFSSFHPVRRSFRILWRFARLSPFPDLNLAMSFLAMSSYLLANGYPLLTPMSGDRVLLSRVISGPPPLRLVQLESRLLERVEGQQCDQS